MELTATVRKRLTCAAATLGNLVAHTFELRIPTTNPELTEEQRKKIVALLEPGDLVLTADTSYLLWEGIEYTVAGSNFTHVSIHEGDGCVLEATVDADKDGVMRSHLSNHLHGPVKVAVIRPAYKHPSDRDAALEFCRSKLGLRYDGCFNMDRTEGQRYYCSSLIYEAFRAMPCPITISRKRRLGRNIVVPDSFLSMQGQTVIYRDKFTPWHALKGATPTAIGAAAATVGFHVMLPHLAPLAGFYLAVSSGNKLQTGRFGLTGGPDGADTPDQAAALSSALASAGPAESPRT